MKNKVTLIIISVVVIAAALVYLKLGDSTKELSDKDVANSNVEKIDINLEHSTVAADNKNTTEKQLFDNKNNKFESDIVDMESSVKQMEAEVDSLMKQDEGLESNLEEDAAWKVATVNSNSQNEAIAPLQNIEMDNITSQLTVGAQISLPEIEGNQYIATIDTTKKLENGDISANGHIEAYGDKYPVTLTQGRTSFFGSISTPNGIYQISVVNGKGTVHSVKDLDKKIDPNTPDVFEPPL